jgi:hypothetical protein
MATSDPKALLDRLLKEKTEVEWLEFKHNNCHPEVIGQTISACANAAMLADRDKAFIVWGIEKQDEKETRDDSPPSRAEREGKRESRQLADPTSRTEVDAGVPGLRRPRRSAVFDSCHGAEL